MNADIYERHRNAVAEWRKACDEVKVAERDRDEARRVLDNVSQELLASCANSKPAKQVAKRGRRAKANAENVVASVTGRIVRKSNGVEDYADLA